MKKMLSTRYSAGAFNTALLFIRIVFGALMMNHGYGKLIAFSKTASNMPQLLGMSGTIVAALVIFAEFFCALFVLLGLFTRYACIPIIITMAYALVVAHNGAFFGDGEKAALFLTAFFGILLVGPGKISVDSMIGK